MFCVESKNQLGLSPKLVEKEVPKDHVGCGWSPKTAFCKLNWAVLSSSTLNRKFK
jgi:hypothetical protein